MLLYFILGVTTVTVNDANKDFNDYTTQGTYKLGEASSWSNKPSTTNDTSTLIVTPAVNDSVVQTLYCIYDNIMWQRRRYGIQAAWSSWKRIVTED